MEKTQAVAFTVKQQTVFKEMKHMKSLLPKFNACLKEKRPEYYSELQKPLTEVEINDLEVKYNKTLPSDLKDLYRWKNGQSQDCYEAFVNNSMFESLQSALSVNLEFTKMIGYDFEIENWWNENWLPIFSNGGGNYICYDIEGVFTGHKGQLIEYWKGDKDRPVIAQSLTDFLNSLNQYYEETSENHFDEFFDISDSIVQWRREFIVDKPIGE